MVDSFVSIKVHKSTRRLLNMLAADHEVSTANVVRWLAAAPDAASTVELGSYENSKGDSMGVALAVDAADAVALESRKPRKVRKQKESK